jgi:hypothetical protein
MRPVSYQGEYVGVSVYPLSLLGRGSVNMSPRQGRIAGGVHSTCKIQQLKARERCKTLRLYPMNLKRDEPMLYVIHCRNCGFHSGDI